MTCFNRASAVCAPEPSLAATPLRVEGDGFLLTYSGQSAINCLYRVWFHGQFCILNLSSTEDTRTNDHVPRVTFSVRPDRRHGEVPRLAEQILRLPVLRLRLKENFDRFNSQFTRRRKW